MAELVPRVLGAGAAGALARHRLHHRRRGSRPARAVARRDRRRATPIRRCRLGGLRPGGAGVPEARAVRDRLPRRPGARAPAAASPCAWSRAPTGTARSSARRCDGQAGYPVFTRKPQHRRVAIWPTRGACSRRATRSIRCSPRTTRTPSPRSIACARRGATAISSSRSCMAWATTCTPKSCPPIACDVPCRVYAPVGFARGPAAVPRAPPAGERRQLQLRQPHHRRGRADRGPGPRSGRNASPASTPSRIRASRCRATCTAQHGHGRDNSMGINLANDDQLRALADAGQRRRAGDWRAAPLVPGAAAPARASR